MFDGAGQPVIPSSQGFDCDVELDWGTYLNMSSSDA